MKLRLWIVALVAALITGCSGAPIKEIESMCPSAPESPCSYMVRMSLKGGTWTPHGVSYGERIQFSVSFTPGTRLSPVQVTRVPFDKVEIEPTSDASPYVTGKTSYSTSFKSGYVEVNPISDSLTIYLFTNDGAFIGNGIHAPASTAPQHLYPRPTPTSTQTCAKPPPDAKPAPVDQAKPGDSATESAVPK